MKAIDWVALLTMTVQGCSTLRMGSPDRFAYGRALPLVRGLWDFRLCYRVSASERLRSLHALSWSWRPD
eukprot:1697549-Prymnesium_polylepis.1